MYSSEENSSWGETIFAITIIELFCWTVFILLITEVDIYSRLVISVISFLISVTLSGYAFKLITTENKLVQLIKKYNIAEYKGLSKTSIWDTIIVLLFCITPGLGLLMFFQLSKDGELKKHKEYLKKIKEIKSNKYLYIFEETKAKIYKIYSAYEEYNEVKKDLETANNLIKEITSKQEHNEVINETIDILNELVNERNERSKHVSDTIELDRKLKETIKAYISYLNDFKQSSYHDNAEIEGFDCNCDKFQNILKSMSDDMNKKKGIFY